MINKVSDDRFLSLKSSKQKSAISFKSGMDKRVLDLSKRIAEDIIVEYDPNLTEIARCKIMRAGKPNFEVKGESFNIAFSKFLKQLETKESFIKRLFSKSFSPYENQCSEHRIINLINSLHSSVRLTYSAKSTNGLQITFPEVLKIGNLNIKRVIRDIRPTNKSKVPNGIGTDFEDALKNLMKSLTTGDVFLDFALAGRRIYKVLKGASDTFIQPLSTKTFSPKQLAAIKKFFESVRGVSDFKEPENRLLRRIS